MSDAEIAVRALRSLDLTDLTDTCSDQAIDALCKKALDPRGPVAAVCVWPQFVKRAQDNLKGSSVRIATVVNFPAGGEDVSRVADDTQEALSDGANEIDLVLPYGALRRGDPAVAREMVEAVREMVDQERLLKVILETGELKDPKLIETASRIAIDAGADFIKTSTGKTPVSASPEAAEIMLNAIKASGKPVGLKPSGGIRTLADARIYLDLADRIMGEGWATPRTFRIGASSVYDTLIAALEGRDGAAASGAY
ncbi:deoxyribose-phosphate aldolase [Microvirga sp. BT689]|uniref:deoxyribose-phosphate aldolase n=1 Tax=Microvirga arvi TaxID=2778731 RepID=UPI0019513E22|nr:deoxyribose-phosphate aldolase [Microvirga arvi]MBM6578658.1 deoxyribose-phosphate aldolase [Microvirga arvi]